MLRRREQRKQRKFTKQMQTRLLICGLMMFSAFIFLIYRVVEINETNGQRYAKKTLSQRTYVSNPIIYKRGDILRIYKKKWHLDSFQLIFNVFYLLTHKSMAATSNKKRGSQKYKLERNLRIYKMWKCFNSILNFERFLLSIFMWVLSRHQTLFYTDWVNKRWIPWNCGDTIE